MNISQRILSVFGYRSSAGRTFRGYGSPTRSSYSSNKSPRRNIRKILLIGGLVILGAGGIFVGVRAYINVIVPLPDINTIESVDFAESTRITDKNGVVLYRLFDEDRQNVSFDQISPMMINAIVAVEDEDFRENNGVDYMGILRAIRNNISKMIGREGGAFEGASTITQQLIKNLFTDADQTPKRKLQELILTTQVYGVLKQSILKTDPNIASSQIKSTVKEKVMELYLNYIFLGNNAYGIETASRIYFGTSAQHLDILQSAILASIPKSPSSVNPYGGRTRLMGKLTMLDGSEPIEMSGAIKQVVLDKIRDDLSQIDLSKKKDNNYFFNVLKGLISFQLTYEGKQYKVEYTQGRKDYSLERMFEQGFITDKELKDAFIEGLDYEFKRTPTTIKAPHFVERITEYLQNNEFDGVTFDKDQLYKGGYTITTSLDYEVQQMSESSFQENIKTINGYGANNSAMVYLDSINGDVIAYVGSVDYNNADIDGKVDMVQWKKQVGSSIKPFVYALGISGLGLTLDTPIYDIPLRMGKDTPNNADGKFQGLMPLRKALAGSRNISAIKMYSAVGGEDKLIPYLESLGISTLDKNKNYGYPLSLGSAEMKLIDLANAYMHLSAMGKPAKINPILEIKSVDGKVLYKKKVVQQKQIIPSGVAYMIRRTLSDTENLPPTWIRTFLLAGLKTAHKSGTTDIKMPNGKQLPRDGLLAIYTPSKVAVYRGGNTEGQPMKANAYGGRLHGNVRKSFFGKMIKAGVVKSEEPRQIEVKNVSVSKISGRLATATTPKEFTTNTLAYIYNMPVLADTVVQAIQVDKLCMGKKTEATPYKDIFTAYIIVPTTFMPNKLDLNDINNRWKQSATLGSGTATGGRIQYTYTNILLQEPKEACPDRVDVIQDDSLNISILNPQSDGNIGKKFTVWYQIKADNPIRFVRIALNDVVVGEYSYRDTSSVTDSKNITTYEGLDEGSAYLTITAIDSEGRSNKQTITVKSVASDTDKPFLYKDRINVVPDDSGEFVVTLLFGDDTSSIQGGTIKRGSTTIRTFDGNIAQFKLEQSANITYTVKDSAGNTTTASENITIPVATGLTEESTEEDPDPTSSQ